MKYAWKVFMEKLPVLIVAAAALASAVLHGMAG